MPETDHRAAASAGRLGWRFLLPYTLANVAMWMVFNAVSQVLLGMQLIALDEAHKEGLLAWILGVGGAVSLFANPYFGALSDRHAGRWGRRRPFLLWGALGSVLALLCLAYGGSVWVLALGWGLVQLALNAYLAAILAIIPDHVPPRQRATVSALSGLSQVLGTVVGVGLTGLVSAMWAKYLLLAAVLVVTTAALLAAYREVPHTPASDAPRLNFRDFLSPLRHRDFALAWLTRGMVNLGFALGTTYLLFYLRDALHVKDPDSGVFTTNAVAGGCLLVTTIIGGLLSDRSGHRKSFVMAATGVIALGLLVMALLPSWTGALLAAALLGAGFGVYLAVDVALITEILPSHGDAARDLGIINFAIMLPQTFAPALCALFVTHLGYPPLFLTGAVVTLLSAVLVGQIRGVR